MSLPLDFHPAVRHEVDDAHDWYEQRQPGLGGAFLDELQHVLTEITANPARYGFADADIRIIDSRLVAGTLGALVRHTVAWIEAGQGADEIIARLEPLFPRGRMYFLVPTLEYLQRGGRVGGAAAQGADVPHR